MKKPLSLFSLIMIICWGALTAQTNKQKDSMMNYKKNMQKMQQVSLMWYKSTDSVMSTMNRTQWDSMMKSMNQAQRDGITDYRSKMLKEKTQDQNRLINDSSVKTFDDSANTETSFILKAAEINREEIKLGKLAQDKGTETHIKDLGKMMVKEHTLALDELTTLAKTKMVNIPTAESEKIMDTYKTLDGKTGNDFDKAYSDMMVKSHKEAIDLFEKHNQDTKDADVKKLTNNMIPILKSHLEHSEKCRKESVKIL